VRSFIQVYALVVCFCALMCFVVVLGIGIYDVVEIAAPEFTLSDATALYDAYQAATPNGAPKDAPNDAPKQTEAELAALRAQQHELSIQYHRQAALQSLVFIGIICAIDLVVFGVHWRIAKKSDPERLITPNQS
jgi:hypothetical protein